MHKHTLLNAVALDAAVIRLDQLHSLAALLSFEEVAAQFSGLPVLGQVALFGLFESTLADVRAVLVDATEVQP